MRKHFLAWLIFLVVVVLALKEGSAVGVEKPTSREPRLPGEFDEGFRIKRQDPKKAKVLFERAKERVAGSTIEEPMVDSHIIECTALAGEYGEALKMLQGFIQRDPECWWALPRAFRIFFIFPKESPEWQMAPEVLKRIQKEHPGTTADGQALLTLARLHKFSGEYRRALRLAEEIIHRPELYRPSLVKPAQNLILDLIPLAQQEESQHRKRLAKTAAVGGAALAVLGAAAFLLARRRRPTGKRPGAEPD